MRGELLGERLAAGDGADVARQGDAIGAEFGCGVVAGRRLAARDIDLRALGDEAGGDHLADAAAAASDERDLAVEAEEVGGVHDVSPGYAPRQSRVVSRVRVPRPAGRDAEQADVAVQAFDAVIGDIAGAAIDLHRLVGDATHHLAGEILRRRAFQHHVFAAIFFGRRFQHHRTGDERFGLHVGDHALDQLVFGDRLAELLAAGGISDAVGDQPFGDADADRADVQPAAVEHAHRDLEAFALRAQAIGDRHRHVVEMDVGDLGALLPHLLFGFADGDAGQVLGHQKGRDAARALLVAGARHHGEQLRLAVDVAIPHRARLHAAGIAADIGFGQREAGDDLAARDARQPFGLLFGRAGHHQPLAADPDIGAERRSEGGRGPPHLDRDAAFLDHVEAQTAVFLGDRQAEQAHLLHLRDDRVGDGVGGLHIGFEGAQPFADEATDGVDQRVEGFGVEGHAVSTAMP
ncbi:hypothetical protein WR25_01935 [Diploscapter pachys]|uniref:Uncharacterized protein n=1 Tax=Diploscapter pachys TaxID=2018661 RepID=A0A2A2KFR0_9BILA|nr:hypothetical protein WR25_01935 [Diploscapter pachys]